MLVELSEERAPQSATASHRVVLILETSFTPMEVATLPEANTKKSKKLPHPRGNNKDAVYELFKAWLAVPPVLRGMDPERATQLGGEAFAQELLSIRTQGEFAKKFGMNEATLVGWKHRAHKEGSIKEIVEETAHEYLPNLMHSFYLKTMKHGDAPRMTLWLKWIEKWTESKSDDDTPTDRPVVVILDGAEYVRNLPWPPGVQRP